MRILIIEDDQEVADKINATLQGAGYATDMAHNGEDGQRFGETQTYAAVILDLGLPLVNGLTVLENWRNHGHEMPVLILSARDTWREKIAGLRTGADYYMAKPFAPEELLARVNTLIQHKKSS